MSASGWIREGFGLSRLSLLETESASRWKMASRSSGSSESTELPSLSVEDAVSIESLRSGDIARIIHDQFVVLSSVAICSMRSHNRCDARRPVRASHQPHRRSRLKGLLTRAVHVLQFSGHGNHGDEARARLETIPRCCRSEPMSRARQCSICSMKPLCKCHATRGRRRALDEAQRPNRSEARSTELKVAQHATARYTRRHDVSQSSRSIARDAHSTSKAAGGETMSWVS